MEVNYFSVFFSILVLTIMSKRGKLVDSIIFSDDFVNKWTKSTRQARNLTTNVPKILDLKSSSEQIFSELKLTLGAPDRTCWTIQTGIQTNLNELWIKLTKFGSSHEKFDVWPTPESIFGKYKVLTFLKLILRSLGSRWFNRQLCLFRIECRVDGLLGLHCIKDSGECNKDWITNNQYWSNWNKIWIQLHYEDGGNRRNLLEQSREPATNSTDIWRWRCGIWAPGGGGYSLMRA